MLFAYYADGVETLRCRNCGREVEVYSLDPMTAANIRDHAAMGLKAQAKEEMRRAIEAEREAIDAGRPASRTIAEFDVEELERMAAETAEAEIDAAEDSVVWSYDDFVNNRQGAIKADAVRRQTQRIADRAAGLVLDSEWNGR